MDDAVNETSLHEELGRLKLLGQLRADRVGDDPRAGEPDLGARLRDMDVAQERETGRHAGRTRIDHDRDIEPAGLVVSGNGDVIEPDDGIAAIGSGGGYALSAARALARHSEMSPSQIAEEALRIAAEICIYTNDNIKVITLP